MKWEDVISVENLYRAWCDFSRGKRMKFDVQIFEASLEQELCALHHELSTGIYHHSGYTQFRIRDPKERIIHKAAVRDRVVHRLVYNELLPLFNARWLDCSFSCRPGFGQHTSIRFVRRMILHASKNYQVPCYAVKLDIRKFFEHIDHALLFQLAFRMIPESCLQQLLQTIVGSFCVTSGSGLPIGNLTSQIFANVYLHELDRFVKHKLKKKFYARYADDFVCCVNSHIEAEKYIDAVSAFLHDRLQLSVHPRKIIVRPVKQGIDWLGVVLLEGYSVLRPSTRRRMMRHVSGMVGRTYTSPETIRSVAASYNGLLTGVACKQIDSALRQRIALCDTVALE